MLRSHIYPIVSGTVVGLVAGLLGVGWLWASVLIAVASSLPSPRRAASVAINSAASSAIAYIAPLVYRASTDPGSARLLETVSAIAGVGWLALLTISIALYVAAAVLAGLAILSAIRVASTAAHRRP